MRRRAIVVLAVLPLAIACGAIQGVPLSEAPTNAGCPAVNACDAYDVKGAKTKPQCNDGRCEFGRPDYPFTVVVNVPNSNFYAPARSFLLASTDLSAQSGVPPRSACVPPTCVQIPAYVRAQGKYRVTAAAAAAVGLPLSDGTSIPVRVSFIPLVETGNDEAAQQGIALDGLQTSSRAVVKTGEILYIAGVPAGRYRRIAYPDPPYDAFFPPVITTLRVDETTPNEAFIDDFVLGDSKTPLDDPTPTGESRKATVTRVEGLEGWRVWLADTETGRRISSLRSLSGSTMAVRLDTSGQTQPTTNALKDGVDVIVAPPEAWIGVPRLQSSLVNGAGLEDLVIPKLPAPASINGVVASGEGVALTGIPAKLLFTSTGLRLGDGTLQPLLRFSTSVSTDDTGNFATLLPPGLYDVTVEPAEGTGFSKVKDTFDTAAALAKTYRPPARTLAVGRVILADGRPLAEAEVLALPSERAAVGRAVKPRPARARTDREGAFRFEVDQGQYDLVVQPQPGTGFPWLVQARSFGTGTAEISPIIVAPPARLSFVLRDPTQGANPIVRAMVRIFVEPAGRGPPAVEIGRGMTDDTGKCEILLAQQAR